MIEVFKFKKEDFFQLDEHHEGDQVSAKELATPEGLAELEARDQIFTLKDGDQILCIVGITPYSSDVGEGWMIMDKAAKGKMFGIARSVRAIMKACPIKTIHVVNDINFKPAEKLAGILGFSSTGETWTGRKGEACSVHVQVKHG